MHTEGKLNILMFRFITRLSIV